MNTIKERADEILKRPMSRGQFLKHLGLLALAVFGVANLLNVFEPKQHTQTANSDDLAYGASGYAGGKKPV